MKEVQIKMLEASTKEYVDIANFDCYDIIIGMLFMHKNKVLLDFVNNIVTINEMPLKAKKMLLCNINGQMRQHQATEKHYNECN